MNFLSVRGLESVYALLLAYSVNVLSAIVILIAGWLFATWMRRSTLKGLDKIHSLDDTLKPILANFVRYGILALVIIVVLAQFGVQTASIIAVIGAAGLAIGLALQGTLSHLASGVIILFLRPFGVGDCIDADGIGGTVKEIGLFATELNTAEGIYVMVPNGLLVARSIKNYSRLPTRRVDVTVGISYRDNIERALAAALSVMKGDSRVLPSPAPQVMVTELADSAVNILLRCWARRDDYWSLYFDLHKLIKQRLDLEGLTIPSPQREVHLVQ
ncbi:MAG TPA: mechanosensitive ion channel domain-containing protein [Micropepsaceae bacterium]|nr:mechanosensitive ion channel domain-containing protein [Micropepsaceae bacterium]